jgi:hypothetical protein
MCKIIDLRAERRARRGTHDESRRTRLPSRAGRPPGLVSIGVVSTELVRRLTEKD